MLAELDHRRAPGMSPPRPRPPGGSGPVPLRQTAVVTVGMTGTTFCDSAGVRTLVRAAQLSAASGGELRLAIGSSPAGRLLQLNRLDQLAPVYRDVRHSLAAPGAGFPGPPGTAV